MLFSLLQRQDQLVIHCLECPNMWSAAARIAAPTNPKEETRIQADVPGVFREFLLLHRDQTSCLQLMDWKSAEAQTRNRFNLYDNFRLSLGIRLSSAAGNWAGDLIFTVIFMWRRNFL